MVGLDISSTAVKLLELSQQNGVLRVEAFAVAPLADGAVTEKNITDVEAVGEAIKRVVQRSATKAKYAAVAVAGSAVISKVIALPALMSDKEMALQIEMDSDQHIPYALDEVYYDFEVMGPSASDPDEVDVLLTVSRKENVELRQAAVELAGLEARIVDVEAYSIENAYKLIGPQIPNQDEKNIVAVVDIGSTMTILSVIKGGNIVYTREQVFGGKQLTEEIQRRYELSFEDAGRAKKEGGLPDDYVPEVLQPFIEAMAQQINRSLQFFASSGHEEEVDHIVLAGGCALIPDAAGQIEASVGVSVSVANPFANMSLSPNVKAVSLSKDAPSMMIACGLAMREDF